MMIRPILGHPRLVVLLVLGLTVLALISLRHGLTLDASAFTFIELEGRPFADYRQAQRHFGSSRSRQMTSMIRRS